MQIEEIKQRKQELETRHGLWTTDNIQLAENLYTLGPPCKPEPGLPYTGQEGVDPRVRTFVQLVADLMDAPLAGLRVLDVGPAEGLMAAEFASHGAAVTAALACEARRERLRFLKESLSLEKLEILAEDVHQFQQEKHGTFDVVLCAGVLDRLDSNDFFPVMKQVAGLCRRLLVLDTHVSLADREAYVHHGLVYSGRTIPPELVESVHASEDGAKPASGKTLPFWLTQPSLLNLLRHIGFTSVYECHNPAGFKFADRHVFVALKGQRQKIHTVPLLNEPEEDRAEKEHLSALPRENADVYLGHEELLTNYHHLQAQYDELYHRHAPFTYLGGILRQLPRMFWQAIRRRLPGASAAEPPHGIHS